MKIQNLTFGYGDRNLFENFNIEFESGKTTAILGKSGVGKTTLLKITSGLIETKHKFDSPVAFVFQEPMLVSHLTVKQNLTLIGASEEEVEKMLNDFEMADKANAYPNALSGGEKQRINLLRAFLSKREIILLDEPFSSLDFPLKLKLIKTTNKYQEERKCSIIFVTHDIEEALMLSHRVVLLSSNQVVLDMPLSGSPVDRNYGENSIERQNILKCYK